MTEVTPLEVLSLAETRRRDPDLAMKIAEQSAAQSAPLKLSPQSTQMAKDSAMASQRVA